MLEDTLNWSSSSGGHAEGAMGTMVIVALFSSPLIFPVDRVDMRNKAACTGLISPNSSLAASQLIAVLSL